MKKTNNKGFSLVELIVVIAIMAVLVGVLAPQFLKYVNNSKISTDLQNAETLRTVTNTLIAEGKLTATGTATITIDKDTAAATATGDTKVVMETLGSGIAPKYDAAADFKITYTKEAGVSKVEYIIGTDSYECYPNADKAATASDKGGINKLKK